MTRRVGFDDRDALGKSLSLLAIAILWLVALPVGAGSDTSEEFPCRTNGRLEIVATIPTNADAGLSAAAPDPLRDLVYICEEGPYVYVVDANSNEIVSTVPVSSGCLGLTGTIHVNVVTGLAYVAGFGEENRRDGAVHVIDGRQGALVAEIEIAGNPTALAVDPLTNRVYVTNYTRNAVTVIDGRHNEIVNEFDVGGTGGSAAVNPVTGRLYVTTWEPPALVALDAVSGEQLARLDAPEFSFIDVNPLRNLIYWTSRGIEVLDGQTLESRGRIPCDADQLAVDPIAETVYSLDIMCGEEEPECETRLSAFDEDTLVKKADLEVYEGRSSLGVDPIAGLLYVGYVALVEIVAGQEK